MILSCEMNTCRCLISFEDGTTVRHIRPSRRRCDSVLGMNSCAGGQNSYGVRVHGIPADVDFPVNEPMVHILREFMYFLSPHLVSAKGS